MSITIFCLVHGTTTPFHVEIDSNKTVSHLKDAIKATMTPELDGWAAKGLRLWKVQIPDNPDDLIKGQTLQDHSELWPTRHLVQYWPDPPPSHHIHVMIKLPEPGK